MPYGTLGRDFSEEHRIQGFFDKRAHSGSLEGMQFIPCSIKKMLAQPRGASIQRGYDVNELQKSDAVSVSRRDFCKKAIKRSSIAAAMGVAGFLAYRKPAVRSFFGTSDAYAASTGPGRFSLKGDSN